MLANINPGRLNFFHHFCHISHKNMEIGWFLGIKLQLITKGLVEKCYLHNKVRDISLPKLLVGSENGELSWNFPYEWIALFKIVYTDMGFSSRGASSLKMIYFYVLFWNYIIDIIQKFENNSKYFTIFRSLVPGVYGHGCLHCMCFAGGFSCLFYSMTRVRKPIPWNMLTT